MRFAYLLALCAVAFLGACTYACTSTLLEDPVTVTWANTEPREDEPEALCDTDTDCMRFCPPPADDPDCDGGPEPMSSIVDTHFEIYQRMRR